MDKLQSLYIFLDLAGTFAFAISGATAARQRGMDLFGICVLAFTVASGGGIIRDLCIGAIPPAGISNWHYPVTALIAAGITIGLYPLLQRIKRPVIFFNAVGLSLFAVTGAEKALYYGHNATVAIILGITTAVGGGVMRDVLLNRVPVILEKEIYASAALLAAVIVVLGDYFKWLPGDVLSLGATGVCATLRLLALKYHWNLPVPSGGASRKHPKNPL